MLQDINAWKILKHKYHIVIKRLLLNIIIVANLVLFK